MRWNSSINLSSARSDDELAEHVIDSLHVVPRIATDATVLDVGAGGGLPCVVLAICRPDVSVTALEPVHKKHAFLRTAARELKLANLEAFARRLDDHAERDYDVAMSRATFDLREWLLLGLERVRIGGLALGFEGVERSDLPEPFTRYAYDLAGKQRAIVSVERFR
ncbi:MAG: 16S rRNA (guanine(527)-N(7))-methyltransferase RsmG [Deltaproteobacteria bacterium]|nr:16S rRNA (guanine(527)-N(7))-methyltransferase RsmG [Deltaproteobacteria bacterium]